MHPVVIVGAGIGGLAAAVELAGRGVPVLVLEQAHMPGGKLREVAIGRQRLDAGPTVFTMRWVFDELFNGAGALLDDHLALQPAYVLARHAWSASERLDLFADVQASADAIAALAGPAEGRRYIDFCHRAERIYRTLEGPFLRETRPDPVSLMRRVGLRGLPDLAGISPFTSMWRALGEHFKDTRLRQLFGRYATYCGSSPFEAPATLMLVAHVEREGVFLVEGGMYRIVEALASLAQRLGVQLRTGAGVAALRTEAGRISGVRLESGETIAAQAVIFNGDPAALAHGLLGHELRAAAPPMPLPKRSLSAIVWNVAAPVEGFELARHNVFFSPNYQAEFDALFARRQVPQHPTVYVCAQDAGEHAPPPPGAQRLLCLVNAPATGDERPGNDEEIARCEQQMLTTLAHCGATLQIDPAARVITQPADFARMFPGTGGALYGAASHGWRASFSRPGSRTSIPGLYLAGGATHPGPGVPMAALSGRLAAASLMRDRPAASMPAWPPAATPGGTSTPSATTANRR
jgi:1-hydroxycarotenoid 3,4-desaturase